MASVRPLWQSLWVIVVGFMTFIMATRIAIAPNRSLPSFLLWPCSLIALYISWGVFQAWVPSPDPFVENIREIATISNPPLVISVSPHSTFLVATFFLSHLAFFFCVFDYCEDRQRAVSLIGFVGTTILSYAIYGFVVYVLGYEKVLWFEKTISHRTLTSTFVNRNSFAAYAGLGAMCLVAHLVYLMEKYRQDKTKLIEGVAIKVSWQILAIFVTMIATVLTHSRAGLISVAIAMTCLILLGPRIVHTNRISTQGLTIVSMTVGVGIVALNLSGDILHQRFEVELLEGYRIHAYQYILNAISDAKFRGFGLGSFEDAFPLYRGEQLAMYFDRAHNDYLESVMSAGLPATIILITAFIMFFFHLATQIKYAGTHRVFVALGLAAIIQMGLHSLVDFSLQIPAISYTWVAILAAALSISGDEKKQAI